MAPWAPLNVKVLATSRDVVVLDVSGELDMATAPVLRGHLTEHVDEGRVRLVLDLSDLSFCDSTGLHLLAVTALAVRRRGGFLRLLNPSRQVRLVLDLTRLVPLLPVYTSLAEATADQPAGQHRSDDGREEGDTTGGPPRAAPRPATPPPGASPKGWDRLLPRRTAHRARAVSG